MDEDNERQPWERTFWDWFDGQWPDGLPYTEENARALIKGEIPSAR